MKTRCPCPGWELHVITRKCRHCDHIKRYHPYVTPAATRRNGCKVRFGR